MKRKGLVKSKKKGKDRREASLKGLRRRLWPPGYKCLASLGGTNTVPQKLQQTSRLVSSRLGLGISVLEARYVLFQMFGVMILCCQ